MEKLSGTPIPATKIFQCGEGARYFGRALRCKPERLRVRCSLAPKRTIAQTQIASRSFPLERNSGMVQCRDTSRQEAEMRLRSPDRFSSRSKFVRRESQPVGGSRRGGRCRKRQLHSKLRRRNKLSRTATLDVVKDRVTSPMERETWVRIPPDSRESVAER